MNMKKWNNLKKAISIIERDGGEREKYIMENIDAIQTDDSDDWFEFMAKDNERASVSVSENAIVC